MNQWCITQDCRDQMALLRKPTQRMTVGKRGVSDKLSVSGLGCLARFFACARVSGWINFSSVRPAACLRRQIKELWVQTVSEKLQERNVDKSTPRGVNECGKPSQDWSGLKTHPQKSKSETFRNWQFLIGFHNAKHHLPPPNQRSQRYRWLPTAVCVGWCKAWHQRRSLRHCRVGVYTLETQKK